MRDVFNVCRVLEGHRPVVTVISPLWMFSTFAIGVLPSWPWVHCWFCGCSGRRESYQIIMAFGARFSVKIAYIRTKGHSDIPSCFHTKMRPFILLSARNTLAASTRPEQVVEYQQLGTSLIFWGGGGDWILARHPLVFHASVIKWHPFRIALSLLSIFIFPHNGDWLLWRRASIRWISCVCN